MVTPASAAPRAAAATPAADQTLTWTTDGDITRYKTAPTQAVAGPATIVFENSAATGNTIGMPHTLTFDTTTEGYNHDVNVNILANPFDANNGRHSTTVTLTPGRYRYFCAIPGHQMVGELVVTDGGGGGEDTTPPTVTAAVTGERDAEGNYLRSATVTLTASDTGSGVALVEYQVDDTSFARYTAPVQVTAPGDHSVQYRATDNAGNVSAVGSVAFRVVAPEPGDTTPPAVAATVSGTRDGAGDYVGSATVTVTAADAESGVASIETQTDGGAWLPYTAPVVVTQPGPHMVHYRATDVAGNTSPIGMAMFTVAEPPAPDTTPPSVTAAVTGNRDELGGYIGTATVTATATDSQSGVRSIEYALDGGAWTAYTAPVVVGATGTHTVRYRATDNEQNVAPEQSVSFTVVEPGADACPNSDDRPTVVIGAEDSGVANVDTGNGCTINDLIAENADYPDHSAFVRHVDAVTGPLVTNGVLSHRDQGAILRAAARSDIGTARTTAFFPRGDL
ncbi:OmpL47-type beta-barrel domain-containing protein [Dactylosporangium sp. CA-092794]|uniref:OmpL47-type beta-barrel domain-containing protein n=1 Tax=Dactylosporangium sp. CA-092794 TaxID=3239929 RepID=UPI003D8B9DBE